jgi:hypothetical protein
MRRWFQSRPRSRPARRLRCLRLEERDVPVVVPVGPEFRVNVVTTQTVGESAVALDLDGDFVVAWQATGADGSGNAVMARRYAKDGQALSGEFRVNVYTIGSQQYPAIASDAPGNFAVVWSSATAQDGSRDGVYARLYSATGAAVTGEFQINQFTLGAQSRPTIAMDPTGDFLVAWEGNYQDGDGYGIYARRYDSSGQPLGPEFRVNDVTAGDQRLPSVALDSSGNFVVAWESGDGSATGVFAKRFDATGQELGGQFLVNQTTADDQALPKVARHADGRFAVVWQSRIQDGGTAGVYARLFDADAIPITDEFRVNTHTTGEQTRPAVAVDLAGEIVVTWQSDGQDGSGAGIYAQRLTHLGVPFNPEFRVPTTITADQTRPAIGMDAYGEFVVAWTSEAPTLSGIIAQRHYKPPVPRAVVRIDDGTRQRSGIRSILLTFNTLVHLPPGGVHLVGPLGAVNLLIDTSPSTTPQTIARVTFAGPGVTAAGLVNGNYRLTIESELVTNFNLEEFDGNNDGLPFPDGVYDFHRLYGDMDGDRDTDAIDFGAFRRAFGTSEGVPLYRECLDGDGDGDIDAQDFNLFRLHFGVTLL